MYKNYKDLNDWMMNIGEVQKQSLDELNGIGDKFNQAVKKLHTLRR